MGVVRLEVDPLTPALVEKAKIELRETPEQREKSLQELRELLQKESTIYFSDRDEVLIRYLRPTKFYPKSALELMKRVADFKQKNKALLDGLMPAHLEHVMVEHDGVNVLINRDQDGRRIFVANVGKKWNTSKVSNDQIFQLFYLIHVAATMEPATQVNGVVVILDFDGLGMKQVTALTVPFSRRLLTFIQDAVPLRLKQVHIVKQPMLFNLVWKIFKPLIGEKLNKRLFFHGDDMKSLHKYIEPRCLPAEYGGELPMTDYSSKDWYPILKSLDSVIEGMQLNAQNKYFHFTKQPTRVLPLNHDSARLYVILRQTEFKVDYKLFPPGVVPFVGVNDVPKAANFRKKSEVTAVTQLQELREQQVRPGEDVKEFRGKSYGTNCLPALLILTD